jgi:hypothetical protein
MGNFQSKKSKYLGDFIEVKFIMEILVIWERLGFPLGLERIDASLPITKSYKIL